MWTTGRRLDAPDRGPVVMVKREVKVGISETLRLRLEGKVPFSWREALRRTGAVEELWGLD